MQLKVYYNVLPCDQKRNGVILRGGVFIFCYVAYNCKLGSKRSSVDKIDTVFFTNVILGSSAFVIFTLFFLCLEWWATI